MGIAMGSSPEEVVEAIGWHRRTMDSTERPIAESGTASTSVLATALAALGPLAMIGISQAVGAGLIIVATAVAGASSLGTRRHAPLPVLLATPVVAVVAGSMLVEGVSFGVRIGSAVLGLMLAAVIVVMLFDRSDQSLR